MLLIIFLAKLSYNLVSVDDLSESLDLAPVLVLVIVPEQNLYLKKNLAIHFKKHIGRENHFTLFHTISRPRATGRCDSLKSYQVQVLSARA